MASVMTNWENIQTFLDDTEKGGRGYKGSIDVGLTDVTLDTKSVGGVSESRFLQISVHQKVHLIAAETHFYNYRLDRIFRSLLRRLFRK